MRCEYCLLVDKHLELNESSLLLACSAESSHQQPMLAANPGPHDYCDGFCYARKYPLILSTEHMSWQGSRAIIGPRIDSLCWLERSSFDGLEW